MTSEGNLTRPWSEDRLEEANQFAKGVKTLSSLDGRIRLLVVYLAIHESDRLIRCSNHGVDSSNAQWKQNIFLCRRVRIQYAVSRPIQVDQQYDGRHNHDQSQHWQWHSRRSGRTYTPANFFTYGSKSTVVLLALGKSLAEDLAELLRQRQICKGSNLAISVSKFASRDYTCPRSPLSLYSCLKTSLM